VCYSSMMDNFSKFRPQPMVVLYTLALWFANSASWADGLKFGEVIRGVAVPVGAVPDLVLSRLSFEMERCGPVFRTMNWAGA
jgi:hypothetical protein